MIFTKSAFFENNFICGKSPQEVSCMVRMMTFEMTAVVFTSSFLWHVL